MAESFRILFVCTGNTCRSPMAEAIARDKLQERGWDDVEVGSAGTAAFGPSPASGGAVRAAAGRGGLDLSSHRARPLTSELVAEANLVLTMTSSHLTRARELGAGDRAALLTAFAAGDEGDMAPGVPDPFGGPDEVYEATYEALEELVEAALSRLEPDLNP